MRRLISWHQPAEKRTWFVLAVVATLLVGLGAGVTAPAVWAQEAASGDRISSIEVVGAQRIEPETVFTYMKVQPGDEFDTALLDESLKNLFLSGLFADVTITRQGSRVIVTVEENPIINQVAFEGNNRIKDDELEAETQLRPRVVYTRRKVESDVARMLELYRRQGRFAATIDPKIIELSDNRVDLVFEIDEGPVTGIRSINFIGNESYSDRRLRSVILTKENSLLRLFSSADRYDPDQVAFDEQLLREFYRNNGFADFDIRSSIVELTPDQEDFILTFDLEEGPRYRIGAIEVRSEMRSLDAQTLVGGVIFDEGDWYSARNISDSADAITELAIAQNFPFADVRVEEDKDPEAQIIDVTMVVFDGPRGFVERINIVGNVRTHDRVIRREFEIDEGDPFNVSKIRDARKKLEGLDYFSEVDIQPRQGSAPDQVIVDVDVKEKSTGAIELAGGFSSRIGPLAQISFRETNLLGRGQNLRVGFTLAADESQLDMSFTEPFFLGRDIVAGFDAFRRITDLGDQSSFEDDSIGGALRLGYKLTDRWRHTMAYRIQRTDIQNIDSNASVLIQQAAGATLESAIRNEFFFNALDRRRNPTDGHFLRYRVEFAGLGGDVQYIRNELSAGYFVPFLDRNFVLGIDGEVGHVEGIGERVRINDNFFLGGDKLRGFDDAGVGPRDLATGDAIGGTLMANGTIELQFPNFLPENLGVDTSIFTDVGLVTDSDRTIDSLVDTGNVRVTVGFGLGWVSPLGPFRVDIAKALVKEDFDETETFRISVGTRF